MRALAQLWYNSGTTLAADDSGSPAYCEEDGLGSCRGSRDGSFIGSIGDDLSISRLFDLRSSLGLMPRKTASSWSFL